jgi:hypothetical protein
MSALQIAEKLLARSAELQTEAEQNAVYYKGARDAAEMLVAELRRRATERKTTEAAQLNELLAAHQKPAKEDADGQSKDSPAAAVPE